jgi:hypothetical protein
MSPRAAYKRAYYLKNREKLLAYSRAHYNANKEKQKEYSKKYYQENLEKCRAQMRAYSKLRNKRHKELRNGKYKLDEHTGACDHGAHCGVLRMGE